MNHRTSIVNVSGDFEETILRLAKQLGRDKNRRAVFDVIYGRGSRPLSKKQVAERLDKSGSGQVVQNALDQLAKHHLIVRMENDGYVNDGSRWVYAKDATVRANRPAIVKFADNPQAAKKVATKRRPSLEAPVFVKPVRRAKKAGALANQRLGKIALKVALLVTNPDSRSSLQTGIEARYIDEGIKIGRGSRNVELKIVLAPVISTIFDMLNTYKPDVIHFSGHGGGRTLLLDNERAGQDGGTVLDFDLIARVFKATTIDPKLLVLVACDTVDGAEQFLETFPAVIAMSDSIDDEAACEFSKQFYQSLSAGQTIEHSIEQAKIVLKSKGYADSDLPTLLKRTTS
jgi:hypothetical protein